MFNLSTLGFKPKKQGGDDGSRGSADYTDMGVNDTLGRHNSTTTHGDFSQGDHTYVITGAGDGSIYIWNPEDGSRVEELKAHESEITSLDCSNKGRYLVSGSADHSVIIWDLQAEIVVANLCHVGPVTGISVTPDGKRVCLSFLILLNFLSGFKYSGIHGFINLLKVLLINLPKIL